MNKINPRLEDWLDWLEKQHPSHKIELGLARIALVKQTLLGDKPIAKQVITVAGTNGKGSSVAFIASICDAAGLSYATFTSPHILRFNERIAVNGRPVSDDDLCESFAKVNHARYKADTSPVELTYFEFNTLLAFDIMQTANLDVAILEVGLGGRLDATNVIDADIALVTSIGLDHEDWLGANIDIIGREKAGIFRPNKPAIFAQIQGTHTVQAHAQAIGADYYQAGEQFGLHTETDIDLYNEKCSDKNAAYWWYQPAATDADSRDARPSDSYSNRLPITIQCWQQISLPKINIAGVIQAVKRLPFAINDKAILTGLAQATVIGRMQRLVWEERTVILDVAHNPQAATYIATQWPHEDAQGMVHCVFAALSDKNYTAVIDCLQPRVDCWYFATSQGERGLCADHLLNQSNKERSPIKGAKGYPNIVKAFTQAVTSSNKNDRILVCGSFQAVSEVLAYTNTDKYSEQY